MRLLLKCSENTFRLSPICQEDSQFSGLSGARSELRGQIDAAGIERFSD